MSFDVELVDEEIGTPIHLPYSHSEGGTNQATLNITYNYSKYYYETLDKEHGLYWLDGKLGRETVDVLYGGVRELGVERYTGEYYVIKSDIRFGELFGKKISERQKAFISDYLPNFPSLSDVEKLSLSEKELGRCVGVLHDTGGYWKPTPGNAGYALNILLNWALQYPNGKWQIS
jgi:hypothetical protein